ncbi:MAG: NOG1 family protein [Halobacteriota archaeon]
MFNIQTVPTSKELLDKAFRKSVRARAGKAPGRAAEKAMILTASNILADNLRVIVRRFPNLNEIDPFYGETIDIVIGIDKLKMSLASVNWAATKIHQLSRAALARVSRVPDAKAVRKQMFGRAASIMREITSDLDFLNQARNTINAFPALGDEPTILVAGYPNVGKSSFVAFVTSATPEIALYPFTTKGIVVGHIKYRERRYQIVDLPGLLDRPLFKRNPIELQAISALKHLGDVILFIIDPSGTSGYTVTEQLSLLNELRPQVPLPIIVAANKMDLKPTESVEESFKISTTSGEGIAQVLKALIDLANSSQRKVSKTFERNKIAES